MRRRVHLLRESVTFKVIRPLPDDGPVGKWSHCYRASRQVSAVLCSRPAVAAMHIFVTVRFVGTTARTTVAYGPR